MNSKLSNDDKTKKNSPRRTRHARNSPNSKLLNAAWPKAPSVPTKQSHIKAVDHSEFQQSWSEWRNLSNNVHAGECSIEDMEVDEDVSMRSTLRRKPTAAVAAAEEGASRNSQSRKENDRSILRVSRRSMKMGNKVEEGTSKNTNIEVCEATSTSDTSIVKKQTPTKAKDAALFIIIHVNKVEVGFIKGPATSPVKMFADKFMVQMENEETKKDLSFRVPCRSITSLELSLVEKPYLIKFTTSNINYVSNGPAKNRRSKGPPVQEIVTLHLGYEGNVPRNIRNDLQELFQVRLADLNLWKKEESTPKKSLSTPTPTKISGKEKSSAENTNLAASSEEGSSKESSTVGSANPQKQTVEEEKQCSDTQRRTRHTISKQLAPTPPQHIARKRMPEQLKSVTPEEKTTRSSSSGQVKVAKRAHHDITDSLEERVKTLEHEAAHYQMLSAQQRLIVQSLEDEIRRNTHNYEHQLEIMREELSKNMGEINTGIADEQMQNENILLLRQQLNNLTDELDARNNLLKTRDDEMQSQEDLINELRRDVAESAKPCTRCTNKSGPQTDETTVPLSVMEETRQNLMQLQVSKEHLSMELERVRAELTSCKSTIDSLRQEIQNKEELIERKNQEIEGVSASLRAAQIDLANSSRSVDSLTRQISQLSENEQANENLSEELNSLRMRLSDANVEIDELKTQISEFEQALKKPVEETVASDWIIERGEVKLTDDVVGVGAWGNVKVGTFRGTRVAVKQIHLLILSPHNRRLFEREMTIASRCRHPCLVQFIGATNDDGTPLFVMELLESNLRMLLSRQSLEDFDCIQIGFDIIRAISYLHLSKPVPIIHRDISSSNVLLYRGRYGWRGKLSDYGAANFVRISMTRHPGGLLYSAPEASTIDQTPKLDVYSFGVLFCEMCTRELPLPEKRTEQVRNVKQAERRTLINNCLRRNIDKRWDSLSVCKQIEEWNNSLLQAKTHENS